MTNAQHTLLICINLIMGFALRAQEYSGGLNWEHEVYDSLQRQSSYTGTKSSDWPASVDLSAYCPEVPRQGEAYSCVGWAVGYAALTIQQAILQETTNKNQITANAYSAMFIYNQIKTGPCNQGAQLSAALAFLRTKGDCLSRDFDENPEDCERKPSNTLQQIARKDTIVDYLTLFGQAEEPGIKVRQVKSALARRQPVIIGMSILSNFYQLRGARYWWPQLGNTTAAGGHALVVVGYDDQAGAFLLFNSWGKEWGDQGFIRVKYEDFGQYCKYAYVLLTHPQNQGQEPGQVPANPETLAVTCTLNSLDPGSSEAPEPSIAPVLMKTENGIYKTTQSWRLGQLFQLNIQTHQEQTFLYVFSVDAQNNIHVHWPRQGVLNSKFKGLNESALVPDAETSITIPGPDKAMKISYAGKDVIYVLASTKPIRDLQFIAEKMRYIKSGYMEKLSKLMGNHLIPQADIEYQAGKPAALATLEKKGYLLPLVLEISALEE